MINTQFNVNFLHASDLLLVCDLDQFNFTLHTVVNKLINYIVTNTMVQEWF